MSNSSFIRVVAAAVLAAGCFTAYQLAAQQPNQSSARAAPAAKSATGASDSATREKIMATDEWKQVYKGYQKLLSTQPVYSPNQIKKINAKLDAQIRNMPTSELQGFLDDWQAKLKILNGKDFQEAQDWLGAYLTNMADGYKRNYLHSMGLTDIPSLSAKQLESAITEIRANQTSIAQDQASFDQVRQNTVQTVEQNMAATQQANQDASMPDGGGEYSGYQSPYSPMMFGDNYIPPVGNYLPL
jgi:hypothetical protein